MFPLLQLEAGTQDSPAKHSDSAMGKNKDQNDPQKHGNWNTVLNNHKAIHYKL